MIQITDEVLEEMVEAIVDVVHPSMVILFGSHAGSAPHPDSDVDLLIVEAQSFDGEHSRLEETAKIRKALSRFRVAKDILVYSRDEVQKWRNSLNHIIGRSLREGKVLYERP